MIWIMQRLFLKGCVKIEIDRAESDGCFLSVGQEDEDFGKYNKSEFTGVLK